MGVLPMTEQERMVFGKFNPKYLCRASDGTLMVYDPEAVKLLPVEGQRPALPSDLYLNEEKS